MKVFPLEKLVSEKSNKKQISGFLESLGWKNKQKGYTLYYKCIRKAINEDGFLARIFHKSF